MFIQTEPMPNPATLKFLPGRPVMEKGTANFADAEKAQHSPLAVALFGLEGISGIFLGSDFITVTKPDDHDWEIMKPRILGAIMDHFTSGKPVFLDQMGEQEAVHKLPEEGDVDPEIIATIKNLIETRVKPVATDSGGEVKYHSFKDGVVLLELAGSTFGLLENIKTILQYYVPEVENVADYRDATPKPGLASEDGKMIRRLLEENINPQVANHGGHIALVDVQDDTVYIRLEGGCQGCGMADVTLKQGVATEIQRVVPSITSVLDVTDHAGGSNPYYQPGKGGMSPV